MLELLQHLAKQISYYDKKHKEAEQLYHQCLGAKIALTKLLDELKLGEKEKAHQQLNKALQERLMTEAHENELNGQVNEEPLRENQHV